LVSKFVKTNHYHTPQGHTLYSAKEHHWSCSLHPDTRIFLHVSDAANHGYSKVMIRTVDSDELVLAIAVVNEIHIDEL